MIAAIWLPAPWAWSHLSFALLVAAVAAAGLQAWSLGCRWLRSRGGSEDADGGSVDQMSESLSKPGRGIANRPLVLLVVGLVLGFLPVGATDLSGHWLAYTGELSFPTLAYLWLVTLALCGRMTDRSSATKKAEERIAAESVTATRISSSGAIRRTLAARSADPPWSDSRWPERIVWLLLGTLLYTTALSGQGPDFYRWGYASTPSWLTLLAAVGLHWAGRWDLAAIAVGTVLSWQLRLSGAVNFWDCAIDPLLVGSSVVMLLGQLVRVIIRPVVGATDHRFYDGDSAAGDKSPELA
ncbi:MAG: hypothetical protein EA381_00625 [Planctomycetaceae bacterium]|nr:MAG: hypothetical protein EA381_00625 [Planctomycetaceae bacterium]